MIDSHVHLDDEAFNEDREDIIKSLGENGIEEYLGNYDYYQAKKKQQYDLENLYVEPQDTGKTKTQIKEERRREKEKRQEANKAKKIVKDIEDRINLVEKQIGGLEMMLCQEEIYSSPDKLKEVNLEKSDLEKELKKLYTKWEEIIE